MKKKRKEPSQIKTTKSSVSDDSVKVNLNYFLQEIYLVPKGKEFMSSVFKYLVYGKSLVKDL